MYPSGLRELAALLALGLLLATCAAPQAGSPPGAKATVQALNTRIGELNAEVQAAATATVPPTIAAAPAAIDAPPAVAEAAPEIVVEVAAVEEAAPVEAEPTPRPIARATVVPTRTPKPLTTEDAAPCGIGQIKGNQTSKIYHVPTGGSYARTKNKVSCFDSEAEAQAAGYRKARN